MNPELRAALTFQGFWGPEGTNPELRAVLLHKGSKVEARGSPERDISSPGAMGHGGLAHFWDCLRFGA